MDSFSAVHFPLTGKRRGGNGLMAIVSTGYLRYGVPACSTAVLPKGLFADTLLMLVLRHASAVMLNVNKTTSGPA